MLKNIKFCASILISYAAISMVFASESIISDISSVEGKTWFFKGGSQYLGMKSNVCKPGIFYTFYEQGKLDIEICEDDKLKTKTYKYEYVNNGIDDYITFDDKKFRVIYKKKYDADLDENTEHLILRVDGSKTIETVDYKLNILSE